MPRPRRGGVRTPIIMLTARAQEAEKVLGLELAPTTTSPSRSARGSCAPGSRRCCGGAERAGRRRTGSATSSWTSRGAELRRAGRPVDVTPIEFKLLEVFIRRRGRALSREQLLDAGGDTASRHRSRRGRPRRQSAQEDRAVAGRSPLFVSVRGLVPIRWLSLTERSRPARWSLASERHTAGHGGLHDLETFWTERRLGGCLDDARADAGNLDADLQRAKQREAQTGDCKSVLAEYGRIAEQGVKTNRAAAAEALLSAAACHDKHGDSQAQKLYSRVVSEFADLRIFREEASKRLTRSTVTPPPATSADRVAFPGRDIDQLLVGGSSS